MGADGEKKKTKSGKTSYECENIGVSRIDAMGWVCVCTRVFMCVWC